jgi:hypothetical protein
MPLGNIGALNGRWRHGRRDASRCYSVKRKRTPTRDLTSSNASTNLLRYVAISSRRCTLRQKPHAPHRYQGTLKALQRVIATLKLLPAPYPGTATQMPMMFVQLRCRHVFAFAARLSSRHVASMIVRKVVKPNAEDGNTNKMLPTEGGTMILINLITQIMSRAAGGFIAENSGFANKAPVRLAPPAGFDVARG